MSLGEIVGLCLTTGLLGGLLGVVAGALLARRRGEARSLQLEQRRAIARWGAARRTLGRATASFVAAFRALSAEDRASSAYSLREQEAQRARAAWFACCREVDRADAVSLVVGLEALAEIHRDEATTDPRAIRAAIDGSKEEAAAFAARLKEADRSTESIMRAQIRATQTAGPARLTHALFRCMSALIDRFSRRP